MSLDEMYDDDYDHDRPSAASVLIVAALYGPALIVVGAALAADRLARHLGRRLTRGRRLTWQIA